MNKYIILAIVFLVVAGWLIGGIRNSEDPGAPNPSTGQEAIVTFDQCVEAGNPVMESFPEQCRTADGVHFVNWRATDQMCTQVITPAANPATGETREFPTPCDVPGGWQTAIQ